MAKVKSKAKSYALRIEAHLVEPLQKLKKRNRRSLNAEINAALEQWIAKAGKARGPEEPKASKAVAGAKLSQASSAPAEAAPPAAVPEHEPEAQHEPAPTASEPAQNGESG